MPFQISAPGPQGPTGPTGATGAQGPAGADGATGAQGVEGPTGPQGPQGPSGQGFDFKGAWAVGTAYVTDDVVHQSGTSYIALQATTGDDPSTDGGVHWEVFALSGSPGPTGPEGPAGAQGAQGPAGATGPAGPAGADGATGATGAAGAQGAQGPAGPGLGIDVTAAPYNATGDGTTDDSAAIQAAIDATDANRGGIVFFPQGRYRIATGLTVTHQGTVLVGEGMPGVKRAEAQGSTRIISDNGITAITCNSGGHATLGFGFENLHVIAASGATTGNGILVTNGVRTHVRNVTVSDYIGGYGMRLDGSTGNAQYAHLENFGAGDCLTGLHMTGTGPNGLRMFGGYLEGNTNPRDTSIGIHIATGDTAKLFGVVVSGYETGIYVASGGQAHEIHGMRSEYNNIGIRIGASARGVQVLGGNFNNNLLTGGGSNVGIQVDSGAANTVLLPGYMDTTVITKVSDSGTDTFYWTNNGTQPFAFFPGSVGVNNATSTHLGSGVGVLAFKNADTAPTTNPTGGGVLYVESGALKYRGASGTVTTLGVT